MPYACQSLQVSYFCPLNCDQMEQKYKPLVIWLFAGVVLVAAMVIIGGITRLTQSGLSMVEWKLIMGSIPPLNDAQWQETFEKYKQFPEFNIVNYHFTLREFKSVFWWEYIHRMLGRLTGLVFIIPFAVFIIQKRIDRKLLKKLLFIFLLGAFQGFIGWFMVKSGLVKDPHVSHLRLAAHLITAFAVIGFILWTTFSIINPNRYSKIDFKLYRIIKSGFALLMLQIVYGAFVAGLKAGLYYNTWPMMGSAWIPDEVLDSISREGISAFLNNITLVQFIHRTLAFVVAGFIAWVWIRTKHSKSFHESEPFQQTALPTATTFLLIILVIQLILGITTLLFKVPVLLGVLHQFGALALFCGYVFIMHYVYHSGENMQE